MNGLHAIALLFCVLNVCDIEASTIESVEFKGANGKFSELSFDEFQKKMKSNEQTASRLSKGEEEDQILNVNEVESKDPELAFYIRVARFGLKSLQAQGHAQGTELLGFTDAMDKTPTTRKQNTMEIKMRVGLREDSSKDEYFFMAFEGDKYLYVGGIAVTDTWALDQNGNQLYHIDIPKPPMPAWRTPGMWIIVSGIFMIILGVTLLLCSKSDRQSKDEQQKKNN